MSDTNCFFLENLKILRKTRQVPATWKKGLFLLVVICMAKTAILWYSISDIKYMSERGARNEGTAILHSCL